MWGLEDFRSTRKRCHLVQKLQICKIEVSTDQNLLYMGDLSVQTGAAPGMFRRGLILPTRGLKYGFQGTTYAKNLRKIVFHLPTGG